jgi:hypothetical protein
MLEKRLFKSFLFVCEVSELTFLINEKFLGPCVDFFDCSLSKILKFEFVVSLETVSNGLIEIVFEFILS